MPLILSVFLENFIPYKIEYRKYKKEEGCARLVKKNKNLF